MLVCRAPQRATVLGRTGTRDLPLAAVHPECRIEAKFALGLLARYRTIILSDIVDAGLAMRQRQQRRLRRRIDMEWPRPLGDFGPCARPE